MSEREKNPPGFADRLRLLMEGWGYSTRQLGEMSEVAHATIANWLTGGTRASLDQVERVAKVFGWSVGELLHGQPTGAVMDRVAELESFRRKAMRSASELLVEAGEAGPKLGAVPEPAPGKAINEAQSNAAGKKGKGGQSG